MDEKYQLVFRGEVLEGQHQAVVKLRLMTSLKLNEIQADKLFAGGSVVVKKSVDAKTAAGFQAMFKKAGARLRVHPLDRADESAPAISSEAPTPSKAVAAEVSPVAADSPTFSLLSLEEVDQLVAQQNRASFDINAPDFVIAELGTLLAEAREAVTLTLAEVDFSVAEPGADLLVEPVQVEPVKLGPLNFEVAEVGATIGDSEPKVVPPAPDTSHLKIAEEA